MTVFGIDPECWRKHMTVGQLNILMREHNKAQSRTPQMPRKPATLEDVMRMPGFEVEVNRLGDD